MYRKPMTHRKRTLLIILCFVCIAGGLSHAQETDITSLIKQLEHTDVAIQNQARQSLTERGEEAIRQLMENALRANHLQVFKEAPPSFVRVNPKKTAPVPVSPMIQYGCANALIEMGTTAVPPLIEALSDDDVYYRENASKLLALIGTPALPPVTAALDAELTFVRQLALDTLNYMMMLWVPELRDPSKRLTLSALPPKKDIFRGFIKALNDTDQIVRSLAIFHVGAHSNVSPESISTLLRFLYYGSPTYEKHTAWVLLHGDASGKGRAVLTKALADRQWSLRFGVALAYADLFVQWVYVSTHTKAGTEIGPLPKSVIPMLAEGLEHPDKEARAEASRALWDLSDHKVDDARKALAAFPPLAIIEGTVTDEDIIYTPPLTKNASPTIESLQTDGITFKFNHFFSGGTITIQPFGGELLSWNVQRHGKSVTITPPKGKTLSLGVYIIKLSGFEDVARNQVNTKITFAITVRPI